MSTTRPVPQRSLPGPARLTVAQRDLDGQIGSSSRSDVQALKSDLDRRKEITRKGEKYADRLMETTPTLPVFRKALTYLTPTQYLEITHERHLYNTCSYPACPNRSKRPFDTKKKIKISWSNRTISDCEGNPEDGFCQRSCHVKSDWVYDRLQEVSVWERSRGVVLLEDQESFGKGGDGEDRAGVKVKEHSIGQGGQGMGTKLPPVGVALSTSRPMEQAKETSKREPIGVEETTNKLGSLHIIERETPTTTPLAPSDPIPTTPNPPRPNPPQPISRREAGSLVQTPQQLSDTFLKASNQMGPVPQLPPEETGDDDHFLKEEEEMGLTWGVEDDEVRSLFKQAEMARDIEG